jgi:hypothetical protein
MDCSRTSCGSRPVGKGRIVLPAVLLLFAASAPAQSTGVFREVFTNIAGSSIANLTNSPAYTNLPALEYVGHSIEGPTNWMDNYGQRMRALLTAPASGTYRFAISSDDASNLYLSPTTNPANKGLIARVDGWTNPRIFTNSAIQQSSNITLAAGQKYYIEVLHKEGGGGDNLCVQWILPSGATNTPIPSAQMVPFGVPPPAIVTQPASCTTEVPNVATFTMAVSRPQTVSVRWLTNGVAAAGWTNLSFTFGPVASVHSGRTFRCIATNLMGAVTSQTAVLHVVPDTTRPTIAEAAWSGDGWITIVYSEAVAVASATNVLNYTVSGGASVTAARLLADGRTVVLAVAGLGDLAAHTVTVSGVRDTSPAANPILPGSTAGVSTLWVPVDIARIRGASEPPGPSSRRSPFAISEIHYNPAPRTDGRETEFIELYNSQEWAEDLGGYRLAGELEYTFPAGTVIGPTSYCVVAPVPADVAAVYGLTNVLGGTAGRLSNGGGTIRLLDTMDAVLLEVGYDDVPPWPAAADGAGPSLVLARPSYGEGHPAAWAASELPGGSPGAAEPPPTNALRTVLINEWLAHTDDPQVDFIELYNHGTNAADVGGCWLTDDRATNKFQIPPGTTIPPRGFAAFTQTQLGFALDAAGETILLRAPDGARVVDAVAFGPQANGVSSGRFPDGNPSAGELLAPTAGSRNAGLLVCGVVINEIMYHPITEDGNDEYIELHNRGAAPADVGGWRIRGGISFNIPSGTAIPAGGHLVIAADAARLRTNYAGLTTANCIGDFSGALANGGERIALEMPEHLVSTNEFGQGTTNLVHIVVDEVTYSDGGRWGQWSDGGGSSLELVDPLSDNRLGSNWADSDETAKSGWVTVEHTGVLDHGNGSYPASQFNILALGAGECLVDNVEVIPQAVGTNVVGNPGFETGTNNWVWQGTHEDSTVEAGVGEGGTAALHLRATGRGDPGVNKVRANLSYTTPALGVATLRARVRWLAGHPEILLRVRGNWLEATGPILTTRYFGTPGAANSRGVANRGPVVDSVLHAPILPAGDSNAVVTARVADPDGVAMVRLHYRVDPSSVTQSVLMAPGGAGFYSATIPGQPAGTTVGFWIEAADGASVPATGRFPDGAPAREALVRFGDAMPTGNFGVYRLWLTQATIDQWTTREKNSNRPLPATFVHGSSRVIYPAWSWYSGSPFHAQNFNGPMGSTIPDYMMSFPKDDLFLGADEFVLNYAKTEGSTQRQQLSYWMLRLMGLPYLHRRYIQVVMNGSQRGPIFEDVQQPNGDTIDEFFPDDTGGRLHKIEDWFEFQDNGVSFGIITATLTNALTTGGEKKMARFRWNWRPRAIKGTANDFTNLYALVDAMDSARPEPYETLVDQTLDVREWMQAMAFERFAGNYDSYGFNRGKNMYTYCPERAPWKLLVWDVDFVFGGPGSVATNDQVMSSHDPIIFKFKTHPAFNRVWWSSLQGICDTVADPSVCHPRIDRIYDALVANSIPGIEATSAIKTWIANRVVYLRSQLALMEVPFAVDGPASWTTNVNYVTLGGTAPVAIDRIAINGVAYRPEWATTNRWTLALPLASGTNALTLQGIDWKGMAVTNPAVGLTVVSTAEVEPAEGNLVFNEIMYNPTNGAATFVEIFNRSPTTAYDLSGWRINGLGLVMSNGVVIPPGGFAVFVENLTQFAAAYGGAIPVAGEFAGALDKGGETLTLIRPGPTPDLDAVIDRVRYDDEPPWPAAADGWGPSLQLIDAAQDNRRVGNWAAVPGPANGPPACTPGATNSVARMLAPLGDLWLNEIVVSNVTGAVDGEGHRGPWVEVFNAGTASVSMAGWHLTDTATNLVRWAFPTNSTIAAGGFLVVWLDADADDSTSNEPHASFRPSSPTGMVALVRTVTNDSAAVDWLAWRQVSPDRAYGSFPDGEPYGRRLLRTPTPGAANDGSFPSLQLFINEWLADNTLVLADPADGQYEDWFELYNPTDDPMDLEGASLTDSLSDTNKYRIPPGFTVPAHGYLLVWADGETNQNNLAVRPDLHAGFSLSKSGEAIGLYDAGGTLVDAVVFGPQALNISEGHFPDGTGPVIAMPVATPGAANVGPATNATPQLASIPAQTIHRGETIRFTATATDLDAPPQTLAFSLDSAPAGSTIDPVTGEFGWTPDAEGPEQVEVARVRVTDDGNPPASAAVDVTLIVLPIPEIVALPITSLPPGTQVGFSFGTIVGRNYQVEFADRLVPPDWQPYGLPFTAEAAAYEILDDSGATQRFFRVRESD